MMTYFFYRKLGRQFLLDVIAGIVTGIGFVAGQRPVKSKFILNLNPAR